MYMDIQYNNSIPNIKHFAKKFHALHSKEQYVSHNNVCCVTWVSTKVKVVLFCALYHLLCVYVLVRKLSAGHIWHGVHWLLGCRTLPTGAIRWRVSLLVSDSKLGTSPGLGLQTITKVSCIFLSPIGLQALPLVYSHIQLPGLKSSMQAVINWPIHTEHSIN